MAGGAWAGFLPSADPQVVAFSINGASKPPHPQEVVNMNHCNHGLESTHYLLGTSILGPVMEARLKLGKVESLAPGDIVGEW